MCKWSAGELKKQLENDIASTVGEKIKDFEQQTGLTVTAVNIEILDTTTIGEALQGDKSYIMGRALVDIA